MNAFARALDRCRFASLGMVLLLAAFEKAAAQSPSADCDVPGGLRFERPMRGKITNGYGIRRHPILGVDRMHTGVDFEAKAGDTVSAAAAGRVVFAGRQGEYGTAVVLAHKDGLETLYGHLQRAAVTPGDCVRLGQAIGWAGSTGLAAGPQLHFEVRRDGEAIDPTPFIPSQR